MIFDTGGKEVFCLRPQWPRSRLSEEKKRKDDSFSMIFNVTCQLTSWACFCCGYCATSQCSLDWFEVDFSARPASSFGGICVLSIFIISFALLVLCCWVLFLIAKEACANWRCVCGSIKDLVCVKGCVARASRTSLETKVCCSVLQCVAVCCRWCVFKDVLH